MEFLTLVYQNSVLVAIVIERKITNTQVALSVEAVEYTDCTSAEDYDCTPFRQWVPWYETKLHLVVRIVLELWGM